MKVADAMMQEPVFCLPDTPASEIAALMDREDCDSVPVIDAEASRTVVGVVTGRDLVRRVVAKGMDCSAARARDCMSHDVAAIDPEMSLEDAYEAMRGYHVNRMLVTDEVGRLRGVLSWSNIEEGGDGGEPLSACADFSAWAGEISDFAEVRRHPFSSDHVSDPTKPALGMSPRA
jgi:CBS domain-containing protein